MKIFRILPRAARIAAPLALALAVFAGCAKHNDLAGKWKGSLAGPGGSTVQIAVEFKDDGTATQNIQAMGRQVTVNSTYTAKDGALTEVYAAGGKPPPDAAANGKTAEFAYKIDGDTLTLTPRGGGVAYVLNRDKS